ncbi:MAG: filamentous hemagglutinin N-terminal domain-containing protein [Rhodocyclaceae bacterium]|nr:filamentous hemagglutinin N-terminal domain-containing protein [Rhodocyclaceae bacterium]
MQQKSSHSGRGLVGLAIALAIQAVYSTSAQALPQGPSVAAGTVGFSNPAAGVMQIRAGDRSIINWNAFSIGAGEAVRFVQPTASSAVLNRVLGPDPSLLMGQLQANGRVFLINPNGILVGAGARIDTSAFVASTLGLSDPDFLLQRLRFEAGPSAGALRNAGTISTGSDGRVLLIAPEIENSGIVRTPEGQVLLAAGRKLEISSLDFENVRFTLQAPADSVLNIGKLVADGGVVNAFAGSLRHSGEIRASRLSIDGDGSVRLVASQDLQADAHSRTTAARVLMQSTGGTTRLAGAVDAAASSGQGGEVQILGSRVTLEAGAVVDASGPAGGGKILIGGDYQGGNPGVQNAIATDVAAGARLIADAGQSGDGGRVIVWGNELTRYGGSLSARGGPQSGAGGFAEISGKRQLQFTGSVDLSAPQGAPGTLLLDPLDIIVMDSGGLVPSAADAYTDYPANLVTVSPAALDAVRGNVTLKASRDLYINSPITLTTLGASLSAEAGTDPLYPAGAISGGNIWVNANISTNAGAVSLTGNEITGPGSIFTHGGTVNLQAARISGTGSIVTSGGAVSELASAWIFQTGTIDAGAGAVTLESGGSISVTQIAADTVSMNTNAYGFSSGVFATVDATERIEVNAPYCMVQLWGNAEPLRVGNISAASLTLSSKLGMLRIGEGLIDARDVGLFQTEGNGTLGTATAPLLLSSSSLRITSVQPFHVQISDIQTLNELAITAPAVALGSSTLGGSQNISTFHLAAAGEALSASIAATGGLSNGLSLTLTDGNLELPRLDTAAVAGPVNLYAPGNIALHDASVATLNVSAGGSIISHGTLTSSANVLLQAGAGISTGAIESGGQFNASTSLGDLATQAIHAFGSITLSAAAGNISTGDISAESSGYFFSNGSFSSLVTLQDSALAQASFGGPAGSGSAISANSVIVIGGDGFPLPSYAAVTLNAGGSVSTGHIQAAGSISVAAAAGGISIGNLLSTSGDISLSSTGAIHAGGVTATAVHMQACQLPAGACGGIDVGSISANPEFAGFGSAPVALAGGSGPVRVRGNIVATELAVSSDDEISLAGVQSNGGPIDLTARNDVVFDRLTTYLYSDRAPVRITSLQGSIRPRNDDSAFDIDASGPITLIAGRAIGDASFAHPLDMVAQPDYGILDTPPVSLTAGQGIGWPGNPVVVHLPGENNTHSLSASAGTALNIALQDASSIPVPDYLTQLDLVLSPAGLGAGNSARISSANLNLTITSDGAALSLPDLVLTDGWLDRFSLSAAGDMNFGKVQLASGGPNGFRLDAQGSLIQTAGGDPAQPNGIEAGWVELNATGDISTAGNLAATGAASLSAVGSVALGGVDNSAGAGMSISGHDISAGNLNSGFGDLALVATGRAQFLNASTAPDAYAQISISGQTVSGLNLTAGGNASIIGETIAVGDVRAYAVSIAQTTAAPLSLGDIHATNGISIASTGDIDLSNQHLSITYGYFQAQSGGSIRIGDLSATGAISPALYAQDDIDVTIHGALGGWLTLESGGRFNISSDAVPGGLNISMQGDRAGPNSGISVGGSAVFAASFDGSRTTTIDLATPNSYAGFVLRDSSPTAGRQLLLRSVQTGASFVDIGMARGDILIDTVSAAGQSIVLTAEHGSILSSGAGSVSIGPTSGDYYPPPAVHLYAPEGGVGTRAAPIVTSNAVSVAVQARNEIGLDMDAATSRFSLSADAGAIEPIQVRGPQFPGLSIQRGSGELVLGALTAPAASFSLTGLNGNIRVNGDLDLNSLYLSAAGSLLVQTSGGPRSVRAQRATLTSGTDLIASAGAAAGESLHIEAVQQLRLSIGGDLWLSASGGQVEVLGPDSTALETGRDFILAGGSGVDAYARFVARGASPPFVIGGKLSILGGHGDGAYADLNISSSLYAPAPALMAYGLELAAGRGADAYASLSSGNTTIYGDVQISGGSGNGAYARVVSSYNGYQRFGTGPTQTRLSNITVEGGSGGLSAATGNTAYAGIYTDGQQILDGVGVVRVVGGGGTGATAEIQAGGYQSIGAQSVLVQGGAGVDSAAAVRQTGYGYAGQQVSATNIALVGGSGAGASASVESEFVAQDLLGSNTDGTPTTLTVQGGSGGQSAASGNSAYARLSSGGSQSINNMSHLRVTGGSGNSSVAEIRSAGTQDVNAGSVLVQAGTGAGAAAGLSAEGGSQSLVASTGLTLIGGTGAEAYVRNDCLSTFLCSYVSQYITTGGALQIHGGTGSGMGLTGGAFLQAASGNQTILAASLDIKSGRNFASARIAADNGVAQFVSIEGDADITTSAGANSGNQSGISGTTLSQVVNVGGALRIHNDHGAERVGVWADPVAVAAELQQVVIAQRLSVLNESAQGSALVQSGGRQSIGTSASCAGADCGINLAANGGGSALIAAAGDQLIIAAVTESTNYEGAMPVRVGNAAALGPATISAGGALTLIASELSVQGGTSAASVAKVQAAGTMDISTLGGSIRVSGGSGGAAAIEHVAAAPVPAGTTTTNGAGTIQAGGSLSLAAPGLTVQGAESATVTLTLQDGGGMDLNSSGGTITGTIGGGVVPTFDTTRMALVATGDVVVTGGGASSSGASINGGSISIAALRGGLRTLAGTGAAEINASADINLVSSGNLQLGPTSTGGATITNAGQLSIGGQVVCTGCITGITVLTPGNPGLAILQLPSAGNLVTLAENSLARPEVLDVQLRRPYLTDTRVPLIQFETSSTGEPRIPRRGAK